MCSSDYRDIDPKYGTLDDWDHLLQGIHQRGMKLMYVYPRYVGIHCIESYCRAPYSWTLRTGWTSWSITLLMR